MDKDYFADKTILITGGTGSLGHVIVRKLFENFIAKKVIIYSRDEYKQSLMAEKFQEDKLRFFIGDVRDRSRLERALRGVDYVVHAAALKRVPALEYNPTEAVKTNVSGTINVAEACVGGGVSAAVLISTDKAVNPVNLYGATKLTAEKIFTAANAIGPTMFSSVRYGNVIGSRGSVMPLFQRLVKGRKPMPVTHKDMTRFWITLDEAAELVFFALKHSDRSGKVIVPQIPSMRIVDIARTIGPDSEIIYTGVRAGEKLHETLIAENETKAVMLKKDGLVDYLPKPYNSKDNDLWLTPQELRKKL
jgi:UDP-N-acetylglucosamine 4,6-dehydratase